MWAATGGNSPFDCDIEVYGPNAFAIATHTDNLAFEGGIYVEEFVDDTLLNL